MSGPRRPRSMAGYVPSAQAAAMLRKAADDIGRDRRPLLLVKVKLDICFWDEAWADKPAAGPTAAKEES